MRNIYLSCGSLVTVLTFEIHLFDHKIGSSAKVAVSTRDLDMVPDSIHSV